MGWLKVQDGTNIVFGCFPSEEAAEGHDLTGFTLVDGSGFGGREIEDGYLLVVDGTDLALEIEAVRNAKWEEVKAERLIRDYGDLTNSKGAYQGDEESQKRLHKAAFLAENGIGTWPIEWTMADDAGVPHSAAEIIAAWGDFCLRTIGLHDAAQIMYTDIQSETDPEVILAMDIPSLFDTAGF